MEKKETNGGGITKETKWEKATAEIFFFFFFFNFEWVCFAFFFFFISAQGSPGGEKEKLSARLLPMAKQFVVETTATVANSNDDPVNKFLHHSLVGPSSTTSTAM